MFERGYPKNDITERIVTTQRATQAYRGVRTPTQWIHVAKDRRGQRGSLDYENGWGEGDPDAPAQFSMDEHGRVRLRGRIAGGTIGLPAFTLPQGFRPPVPQSFNLANGQTGYAIVEVSPNGEVTIIGVV